MKNTLGLISFRWFCATIGFGFLTACTFSPPAPTPLPTAQMPSPTTIPPTPSATLQLLPSPPVQSLTARAIIPSPTGTASTVTTEASATAVSAEQVVKIFLIAIDDNGRSGKKIGCGDSVIPVLVQIPHTVRVLKAALEALLSVKTPNYGESGLYNALYQADLHLESAAIDEGTAQIRLQGTLGLRGMCDNPRVEAQLTETALQFSTVKAVAVYINGIPLEQVLSPK